VGNKLRTTTTHFSTYPLICLTTCLTFYVHGPRVHSNSRPFRPFSIFDRIIKVQQRCQPLNCKQLHTTVTPFNSLNTLFRVPLLQAILS
jgi:hypothetical protein